MKLSLTFTCHLVDGDVDKHRNSWLSTDRVVHEKFTFSVGKNNTCVSNFNCLILPLLSKANGGFLIRGAVIKPINFPA